MYYQPVLITVGIVFPEIHILDSSTCADAACTYEAAVALVGAHVRCIQAVFASLAEGVFVTYAIVLYLHGIAEDGRGTRVKPSMY